MKTFTTWDLAGIEGFHARGYWRDKGFTVKKDEKAHAQIENFEILNRRIPVYSRDQVRELKEPQKSKRVLIGCFLRRHDYFGIRDFTTGEVTQHHIDTVGKTPKDLVYSTWLYKNRTCGVRTPFFWNSGIRVEGFDFRAGETTNYLVLDVDNHRPTHSSTQAHLLLVRKLVGLLPRLLKHLGECTVFFDYRQDAPEGIHIWLYFNYPRETERVHERVRTFLMNNADAELDALLRNNGLAEMGSLEILPSQTHCMRFFGTYDRRVFTTTELKPKNNSFDAESLLTHLRRRGSEIGDPCERYGELAHAGLGYGAIDRQVSRLINHRILEVTSERPQQQKNYFVYLVDACLYGVGSADVLYGSYLRPLANALYFREFHDHPQRDQMVVATLMKWLELKHNGMVSRIKDDKGALERGIRNIIRKMNRTPPKVRAYWASVVKRDSAHPDRKISLVRCMETVLGSPVTVTKTNLDQVRRLVQGDEACPILSSMEISLPSTVEARLRDHLGRAGVAPGKCTDRIVCFAENLIGEIGVLGYRRIPHLRINELAELGKGRRHAARYKRLIAGAGVIEPDSDKTLKVGVTSSLYRLTDWVLDEVVREDGSPPVSA
jgi:hypothetical protein